MDYERTLSTKGGAKAALRCRVMPVGHTRAVEAEDGALAAGEGRCSVGYVRGSTRSARAIELAFLGDPLKGFVGALDAVLMLVAIRRQKFHDLISPVRSHVTERLRREIDCLTEPKLVCVQR